MILVWLCENKIWRKKHIMLRRYRQFHCLHKSGQYFKDIAEDAETRFDASNYELDRPLPKRKKKKVIGLMKD